MKRNAPEAEASGIDLLPYDLIFDVLLRLRVKTLCKLRCVCRRWNSLISDSIFQEEHHRRSELNPILLLCSSLIRNCFSRKSICPFYVCLESRDKDEGTLIDEFEAEMPSFLGVIPSCSDLICIRHGMEGVRISFCNPTTHELVTLPDGIPSSAQLPQVGFGYLPSSKQFKVVRFLTWDRYGKLISGCEIFTLGDDCWRLIENSPSRVRSDNAPFVNGHIHVLFDGPSGNLQMAKFDLDREQWHKLMPPPMKSRYRPKLRELGGYLCLINFKSDRNSYIMELWFLKNYEKQVWVKEHTIDFSSRVNRETISYWYRCDPMRIEDDGRILINMAPHGFLYYDSKLKNFCKTNFRDESMCTATLYTESFVALGRK